MIGGSPDPGNTTFRLLLFYRHKKGEFFSSGR
jgi:hypothetical protein